MSYTTVPSGPKDSFLYEVDEPNKLYRWRPENGKDTGDYFIIKTLTSSSFVVTHGEETFVEYEYYYAK